MNYLLYIDHDGEFSILEENSGETPYMAENGVYWRIRSQDCRYDGILVNFGVSNRTLIGEDDHTYEHGWLPSLLNAIGYDTGHHPEPYLISEETYHKIIAVAEDIKRANSL